MLRINENEVIQRIKKHRYRKLLFQGPDGLRNQLVQLAQKITGKVEDIEIIIDGERDFGACDIPYDKAIRMGVDAIFHFGHAKFPATKEQLISIIKRVPVEYFPVYDDKEVGREIINKLISKLGEGRLIAAVYSVQYKEQFLEILKELKRRRIAIANMMMNHIDLEKWRVIGCDIGLIGEVADKVDGVIVVSGGLFHALGVGLYSGLPTLMVDIPRGEVYNIEREIIRYRSLIAHNISRARDGDNFGVIVSNKSFQYNYSTAKFIHNYIVNKLRKKSVILTLNFINNEELEYFPSIDIFVQTACPRVSIDDITSFKRPILNIEQFLIFIGKKSFEEVYPWREPRLFQE